MATVTVEEVGHRREWRRFLDLPIHLHRGKPGWVPPLATLDRWVLDPVLNPALVDASTSAALLARRRGRPVGRIAVHVVGDRATFSHLDADPDDDGSVVAALIERARELAEEDGATELRGPVVPGDPTDPGLRIGRHDERGGVGLPWCAPELLEHLERTGGRVGDREDRWRCRTQDLAGSAGGWSVVGGAVPAPYRGWRDDRLLVQAGDGRALAVPDVVGGLAGVGVGGAWQAARRAKRRDWHGCAVAELVGAPHVIVPALAAAAAAAGYEEIVSPWGGAPKAAVPHARVTVGL